ncbi:hypothetical protein BHE74_00055641 [Ensete ventricosum]|nr:hypothetical protein BHE74_00055641 [Ensete ventricosum]RZS27031.1 hypothetical protein BHM03_00060462 [Ensete ventricosum]
MSLLLLMSFYTLVFMGYCGPLLEMVKGIVFRASYALVGPYDFTQTWVGDRRGKRIILVSITERSQLTLLLLFSSSTIAATLSCHPSLGDFTTVAPTSLPLLPST